MADAKIKAVGDMKHLIGEINRVNKELGKTQRELKQLKKDGVKAGGDTSKGMKGAKNSILGVAAGMGIATSATALFTQGVRLAIAEMDNLKRKRAEASDVVGTIARERARALKNVPVGQEAMAHRIVEEVATRKDLPLGRAAGYRLIGSIFSGASGLEAAQKEAAFKEAAKEAALTGDPETEFAGTLVDMLKGIPELKKHKDPKVAAEMAAGAIQEFGKAARPEERAQQATLMRRLLSTAIGTGTSPELVFELGAAISQGGGDVEGNITGTVVGRFFKNLRKARTGGYHVGGGKMLEITSRGDQAVHDMMQGVSELTPDEQDVFFGSFALGRSNIGFAVADVIGKTARGQELFGAAQKEIGPISDAGAATVRRREKTQGGKFGQYAKIARQFDASIETERLANIDTALAGLIQNKVPTLLRTMGESALEQKLLEYNFAIRSDEDIQKYVKHLLTSEIRFSKAHTLESDDAFFPSDVLTPPTTKALDRAARLEGLLERFTTAMEMIDRAEAESAETNRGDP